MIKIRPGQERGGGDHGWAQDSPYFQFQRLLGSAVDGISLAARHQRRLGRAE